MLYAAVAIALLLAAALLLAGAGWLFSAPPYRGPRSDHFDGRRFHNLVPTDHGPLAILKWILHREKGEWRKYTETPFAPPPPRRVGPGELRVTLVNHATVLLQMDGVNLLTDPVWSERVSPVSFLGPRRHRPPGIRFEDLPPIDVVAISHNHYDHLDLATLEKLQQRDAPLLVAPLGIGTFLKSRGLDRVVEADWWQEVPLTPSLHAVVVPAQHFSSRGAFDRDTSLWGGFVFAGRSGRVYFAGDTGLGPHLQAIARRFAPFRLALLPIGAFRPRWFMKPVHMSPEDAVVAHFTLGAPPTVAVHHGTFFLGDDGEFEPADELRRHLAPVPDARFWILDNGESCELTEGAMEGGGRAVPARAASGGPRPAPITEE